MFVLDEIDKIGEVAGVALLDALDPKRNTAFHDHYLDEGRPPDAPERVTVTESMVREVLGARAGHGEGLPAVKRVRAAIELGDLPPEARRRGKREQ